MPDSVNSSEKTEMTGDEIKNMYLTFHISTEVYGIELRYVLQIIEMPEITVMPEQTPGMIGIINLRGNVIPVTSMRMRFGKPEDTYNDRACIIITQIGANQIGIVVDEIQETLTIEPEDICPPPSISEETQLHYVSGIAKLENNRVAVLIDLQSLFKN